MRLESTKLFRPNNLPNYTFTILNRSQLCFGRTLLFYLNNIFYRIKLDEMVSCEQNPLLYDKFSKPSVKDDYFQ